MANLDAKTEYINNIVNWAYSQENVRAVLSVGSSIENDFDPFFYDLIIVVMDSSLFSKPGWLYQATNHFVKLEYVAEGNPYAELSMMGVFEDGTKLRYQIWLTRSIVKPLLPPELDDGFTTLLDKDNLVDNFPLSNQKMYIPTMPKEREYSVLIERFFFEITNIARYLRNKELLPAKYYFYKIIVNDLLSKMLEWHIEFNNEWSVELNSSRIGFGKLLGEKLWSEYKHLYVGPGYEESWAALSQSIKVFRKVAIEFGNYAGFSYPHEVDKRVTDYVRKITTGKR